MLELLVVLAIMTILMGLVLVGLNAVRENSRDQARVSKLHTIVIGLQQYHDVCRVYPWTLNETETCPELGNATLGSFIPEVEDLDMTEYDYVALAKWPDMSVCTGFHIGVLLEGNAPLGKAGVMSGNNLFELCDPGTGDIVDGIDPQVFDIKK